MFHRLHRAGLSLVAAALFAATPAHAGTLIVSGDSTIGARFATAVTTGTADLAGNIAFQRNIAEGGAVQIARFSAVTTFPNPPLGDQVASAYNTIGITANAFEGDITARLLRGSSLLVVLARSNAFSQFEAEVVRTFLNEGGNVLLAGEASNIGFTANANINTLLTTLGSTIRLAQVAQDPSDRFATGSEIATDPLTSGVTSFGYGFTTTVSGGRTLFLNDSGNAFVAAEEITAAIPEPATWMMLILGFAVTGGSMRRVSRARRNLSAPLAS